jgi:hypothetical protein
MSESIYTDYTQTDVTVDGVLLRYDYSIVRAIKDRAFFRHYFYVDGNPSCIHIKLGNESTPHKLIKIDLYNV